MKPSVLARLRALETVNAEIVAPAYLVTGPGDRLLFGAWFGAENHECLPEDLSSYRVTYDAARHAGTATFTGSMR